MIYNQIVTWTAFAILAMFSYKSLLSQTLIIVLFCFVFTFVFDLGMSMEVVHSSGFLNLLRLIFAQTGCALCDLYLHVFVLVFAK